MPIMKGGNKISQHPESDESGAQRSDTLTPKGIRLRYVQCPQAPFVSGSDDNVCEGK